MINKTWNTINFFLICFGYLLFSLGFSFLFEGSEQNSILFRLIILIVALFTLTLNLNAKLKISIEQKLLLLLFSLLLFRIVWNSNFGYEKDIEISELKRLIYLNLYTLIGLFSLIFSSNINYQLLEKLIIGFLSLSVLYIASNLSGIELEDRYYLNEKVKISQSSFIALTIICYFVINYNNLKSKIIKFYLFFTSIVSLYIIFNTQSRISSLTILVIISLALYKKNKFLFFTFSSILIYLFFNIFFTQNSIFFRRFLEFEFYESRSIIYSIALEKLKSNFLIGSGFSFPFGKDQIYYGHNIFIDIIHMTGFLGLIILYYPLKKLLKHYKELFVKSSENKNIISLLSILTLFKLMTSGSIMFEPLFFFTCFELTKSYS